MTMGSPPTLWNIDDKSDYLGVESDGLKVIYKGVISFDNLKVSYIQQLACNLCNLHFFLNLNSR